MKQCPVLHHHATRSLHYRTDDIRGARAKPSTILLARHAKQVLVPKARPRQGRRRLPRKGEGWLIFDVGENLPY